MGLPINKSAILFLTALCVILLSFLLIFYGMDYARALLEQFGFDHETVEEAYFREAVECAYYRCEEGCGNLPDKVKDYEFPTPPNGELKICKEDFCDKVPDAFKKDGDKEICGDNAKQYPVEVYIEDEAKVSKDRLKSTCIATDDSWFDFGVQATNKWFIFIRKVLIEDIEGEYCKYTPLLGVQEAVKDALFSGSGYIYTYDGTPPINNRPIVYPGTKTTLVDDAPTYITLEPEIPQEVRLPAVSRLTSDRRLIRIKDSDYSVVFNYCCANVYTEEIDVDINGQDKTTLKKSETKTWDLGEGKFLEVTFEGLQSEDTTNVDVFTMKFSL